jgi:hypothetical protein
MGKMGQNKVPSLVTAQIAKRKAFTSTYASRCAANSRFFFRFAIEASVVSHRSPLPSVVRTPLIAASTNSQEGRPGGRWGRTPR